MKLKCDCCGRIEREPFDEGDTCYSGCGIFREIKEDILEMTEQEKEHRYHWTMLLLLAYLLFLIIC